MESASRHGLLQEQSQLVMLSTHIDPKEAKSYMKNLRQMILHWHQIGNMDIEELLKKPSSSSIDGVAKLYQALQTSDFFKMIREEHFRINPQERNDE